MGHWELFKFCWSSLWREYGLAFITRVVLPHPLRTVKGFSRYMRSNEKLEIPPAIEKNPAKSVVGLGFCLKPINPVCVSGRPNHDCYYLENILQFEHMEMPECCRSCLIREVGTLAVSEGYHFYIMTSAHDILFDMFLPALKSKRFTSAYLGLCRYSMAPFQIAMLIVGLKGHLIPYRKGDCLDYKSWRQADIGQKDEQTELANQDIEALFKLLGMDSERPGLQVEVKREGNIFLPG